MPSGQNFAQYFRSLQILFFALLFAQIAICAILWVVRSSEAPTAEFQEDFWLQGITVFALFLLVGSLFFRKKMVDQARAQEGLSAKLSQYRSAQIIGWALMEGTTLINVVFFFLSGKMEFLYIAGVVVAMYATRAPSKMKLVNELELSAGEQNTLDDPNAEVFEPPISQD